MSYLIKNRKLIAPYFIIFSMTGCSGGGTSESAVTPKPTSYSVSINITGSGEVSASQQQYTSGTALTFSITPNEGYMLETIAGCGVELDYDNQFSNEAISLVSAPLAGNCELSATFIERIKLADIFESDVLRSCAINNGMAEGEATKEYADEVRVISCSDQTIVSTSGIEHLVKLEHFVSNRSHITALDFSNNSMLTTVMVDDNSLMDLDVSNNPNLTSLRASRNQLTQIDVSNSPTLSELLVNSNGLTSINISENLHLSSLDLSNNAIGNIDLSGHSSLKTLGLSSTSLTELDLTNNTSLETVRIDYNELSTVDFSNNTSIRVLSLNGNAQLVEIDLSMLTQLKDLFIDMSESQSGKLTQLDLSQNTLLERLLLDHHEFNQLDITNNKNLTNLSIKSNQLTDIDLSNASELQTLDLRSNNISVLDLSFNNKLTTVYYDNDVTCTGDVCN
ncbi:hypothetical protein [Thalassotalea sp. G2M2-11]|uniref:InlB B-repeat-containing protein n=1 Tax=Thalassotalea sp. G2M2-11 TaxID=2787627 RepID=UPI0019D017B7|nr:hypothetical protein [Thalassotalea sp. G2M2-11]